MRYCGMITRYSVTWLLVQILQSRCSMILKYTTSIAQVTTILSREDRERTASCRLRHRVSLQRDGKDPETHQASWELEASFGCCHRAYASWNAEQAMSPGRILAWGG